MKIINKIVHDIDAPENKYVYWFDEKNKELKYYNETKGWTSINENIEVIEKTIQDQTAKIQTAEQDIQELQKTKQDVTKIVHIDSSQSTYCEIGQNVLNIVTLCTSEVGDKDAAADFYRKHPYGDEENEVQHYMVRFTVPPAVDYVFISFVDWEISWANQQEPKWKPGKTYEISIINNCATWAEFDEGIY